MDLAVAQGERYLTILLGNGDGTFNLGPSPAIGESPTSIAVGDFNGDGLADLAVANDIGGSITVLLGNGDGSFTAAPEIATGQYPYAITTGDFNGDGVADLAVAIGTAFTNMVTVYTGNGDGTFTAGSSTPSGNLAKAIAVGDFNGDGIADLATANTFDDNVTILLGKGDGTFAAAPSPAAGKGAWALTVEDLNGDGIADLAVTNYDDSTVTVLLGKGDGTFAAAPTVATGGYPEGIATADFNQDGIPDLAVACPLPAKVTILLGVGDGTFTAGPTPATITGPESLVLGDFNGDGIPDIATTNDNTSALTVLLTELTETATATVTGVSLVGTGTHMVEASFPGDTTYGPSTSGTTNLTAQKVPTTLSLVANPANSGFGQQVGLTATLTPNLVQAQTAGGVITFLNGSTNLGTGMLSSGAATLNVTSLPVGSDTLTASYQGDTNFSGATSAAVAVTIVTPDFSIAANPSSLTIQQGATGKATFTITPTGGFNQSVQFACSGLPANSTCTFSPSTVTPNGAAISSTVTISTNVSSQTAALQNAPGNMWLSLALPFGPAGLPGLWFLSALRRNRRSSGKRLWFLGLLICGAMSIVLMTVGCGGGSKASNPVTPAGTSTVTVTASSTGGTSHSATLTLTIAN